MKNITLLLFPSLLSLFSCWHRPTSEYEHDYHPEAFREAYGTYEITQYSPVSILIEYYHLNLDSQQLSATYKYEGESEKEFSSSYKVTLESYDWDEKQWYRLETIKKDSAFPFVDATDINVYFENGEISIVAQSWGVDSETGEYWIMRFSKTN